MCVLWGEEGGRWRGGGERQSKARSDWGLWNSSGAFPCARV